MPSSTSNRGCGSCLPDPTKADHHTTTKECLHVRIEMNTLTHNTSIRRQLYSSSTQYSSRILLFLSLIDKSIEKNKKDRRVPIKTSRLPQSLCNQYALTTGYILRPYSTSFSLLTHPRRSAQKVQIHLMTVHVETRSSVKLFFQAPFQPPSPICPTAIADDTALRSISTCPFDVPVPCQLLPKHAC